jgi:hypothetical protein
MMTSEVEKITSALPTSGLHLGDVVWCSLQDVRVTRQDLHDTFVRNGLDPNVVKTTSSPEGALGKAISGWREREQGDRIFLRRSEKRSSDCLIVRQEGRVFHTMARVWIRDAQGVVHQVPQIERSVTHADHRSDAIFHELALGFAEHFSFADSSEVGATVVDTILNSLKGIRLKNQGHVYWIPGTRAREIRALKDIVDQLGQSFMSILPIHESKEARASLQVAATQSFEQELKAAVAELTEFTASETIRVSTLERRLEQYGQLREKVELYADILATKKDQLLAGLEGARQTARNLIAKQEVA